MIIIVKVVSILLVEQDSWKLLIVVKLIWHDFSLNDNFGQLNVQAPGWLLCVFLITKIM